VVWVPVYVRNQVRSLAFVFGQISLPITTAIFQVDLG